MLQNLEGSNGFFEDEFIEDYIHGLLYKIHQITLDDGRPGNLAVKILNSTQPYAFCSPSGTVVITTGLLSTIRSEDELIGVLAHEVAHFVLDHQIVNINKAVQRVKRAEFWTGVATTVAAASDIYLDSQYDTYPTGSLTIATAILSSSIANSIIERMGANYSIEQEWEADDAATKILTVLNKDPNAFSVALSRIFYYCSSNGDYLSLSGGGTHPDLGARINKIGSVDPNQFNSTKYDQYISVINTYNAINEYSLKHIESTLNLTSRNFESGVATEDDYIIRAMAMKLLDKNQEALDLLNKAKLLNIVPNSYIYKQEGITLIRLGKPKEAVVPFEIYLQALQEVKESSTYVSGEIEWTKKMIFKVGVL
jgi:predicted Zn-dependent protease